MIDLLQKYLDHLKYERNLSDYTIRNYRRDLLHFFSFLKTNNIDSLENVNKTTLRDYLANLYELRLAKTSIARKQSTIRTFYRYLREEDIIALSPVSVSGRGSSRDYEFSIKLGKHLPSFLTKDEITRLLNIPDITTPYGQRDRAVLELIYASGLRISELINLDMTHIQKNTNEMRIWGKGSRERIVFIGKPAERALSLYLKHGRRELLHNQLNNAVFLNDRGKRLSKRFVQRQLNCYANKAGINHRVYPHMLRHTFATHLLDGGADLRVVQELLGHASLSTTQIYTHITKSQARKVYMSSHPLAKCEIEASEDKCED
jgi:integrase/recombinase XerC